MGSQWVCSLELFLLLTFGFESVTVMRNIVRSCGILGENINIAFGIKLYKGFYGVKVWIESS